MPGDEQFEIFSPLSDLDFAGVLLADLHNDLSDRVSRYRQLADLSSSLGSDGSIISGGEVTYTHWAEARSSFVNGNFAATVFLCQGLAEHLLASFIHISSMGDSFPPKISFQETIKRALKQELISVEDEANLRKLMDLRNPLSHYRTMDDPSSLTRRSLDNRVQATQQLEQDAQFAIGMAVRLLNLPSFRIGR